MAKYRKKPVVIEAIQWTGNNTEDVRGFMGKYGDFTIVKNRIWIRTIHQNQEVELVYGDWIIPEPDGIHFYPCKPDIFEATYEKVE